MDLPDEFCSLHFFSLPIAFSFQREQQMEGKIKQTALSQKACSFI